MSASNKVPENLNYLSNVSFRLTMEDLPMTWFVNLQIFQAFNRCNRGFQPTQLSCTGSRVSFEELSVRFIVDEHMKNWTEIMTESYWTCGGRKVS